MTKKLDAVPRAVIANPDDVDHPKVKAAAKKHRVPITASRWCPKGQPCLDTPGAPMTPIEL